MKIKQWVQGSLQPAEVAREIYLEHPAGIRQFLLRKWVAERKGKITEEILAFMQACVEEADRLSNAMAERNIAGSALEKQGQTEAAIELYEENVTDWFDGNHPYERLRVIYTRRKQYDDSLRVCKAFLAMSDRLQNLGSPREDLAAKADRFQEWIHRLEARRDS